MNQEDFDIDQPVLHEDMQWYVAVEKKMEASVKALREMFGLLAIQYPLASEDPAWKNWQPSKHYYWQGRLLTLQKSLHDIFRDTGFVMPTGLIVHRFTPPRLQNERMSHAA